MDPSLQRKLYCLFASASIRKLRRTAAQQSGQPMPVSVIKDKSFVVGNKRELLYRARLNQEKNLTKEAIEAEKNKLLKSQHQVYTERAKNENAVRKMKALNNQIQELTNNVKKQSHHRILCILDYSK